MKRLWVFVLLLACAGQALAGGNGDFRRNPRAIRDHYIVVLESTVTNVPGWAEKLGRENAIWPERIYEHAIKGFSAVMSEAQAMASRTIPESSGSRRMAKWRPRSRSLRPPGVSIASISGTSP